MLQKSVLALGAASIVVLLAGILLANRGIIPPMAGFGAFILSGLLGLAAIILSIVLAVKTQEFHVAMIGMLGMLPLLLLAAGLADGSRFPPINDITTDTDNPPAFTHAQTLPANQGRDMTFPAKFAGIIRKAYPDLVPATMDRPPEDAFPRALEAARQQTKWEITHEDAAAGTIEAVATTRVFRWKDDIVIRIAPDGDNTRIDMRSKSRDGRGDLGANAKRIRAYFESLGQ